MSRHKRGIHASADLYEEIERLAAIRGLKLNKSELTQLAIRAFNIFSRCYPDNLPYPQMLIDYLHRQVEKGDEEALEHLDYLESWTIEQAKEEISDGVTVVGDAYIVG